jgi:hypothetical protein
MNKKLLFFVSFIAISFSTVSLANNDVNNIQYDYDHNYGEKFTFLESDITFSVFRNGEFDFYINPRKGIHANIDLNQVNISYNSGYNYDPYVQYDVYGAIIQIENVPIYYDYYGRVNRVGNIRIHYHKNRLARIGGLYVYYNPYGYYSHYSGYINTYNRYYSYYPYHHYFIRPYYNNCVVSYNPYRSYYKPVRYDYYYYKTNHKKNHRKNRNFKNIDARVADRSTNSRIQRTSIRGNGIVVNNNDDRSKNSHATVRTKQSGYTINKKNNSSVKRIASKPNRKEGGHISRNSVKIRTSNDINNKRSYTTLRRSVSNTSNHKTKRRTDIVKTSKRRGSKDNSKEKTIYKKPIKRTFSGKKNTRSGSHKSVTQTRNRSKRKSS